MAAGTAQPQIVVEEPDQPPSPKRPSRAAKPSAKVREAMQSLEDTVGTARRVTNNATRTTESRGTRMAGEGDGAGSQIGTGKTALQTLLEMRNIIVNQQAKICELRDVASKQQEMIQELHRQSQEHQRQMENALADTKAQLSEELKQAREQIDALARNPVFTTTTQPSPRASYAEIARTPPSGQPSGIRTLSSQNTMPSAVTDTLFCTVDTSRVDKGQKDKVQAANIRKEIELEIQRREHQGNWRCVAVVKEARNPDRIRVICREESEVALIKEAAQKIAVPGVRVLRDQLYLCRMDFRKERS